jgi:hypothetical protein
VEFDALVSGRTELVFYALVEFDALLSGVGNISKYSYEIIRTSK